MGHKRTNGMENFTVLEAYALGEQLGKVVVDFCKDNDLDHYEFFSEVSSDPYAFIEGLAYGAGKYVNRQTFTKS